MEQLTIYQLRNLASDHFRFLKETEGIDSFCSSLDWLIPAHASFIPDHPLYLLKGEHGYVTLAGGFSPQIGRYLHPLEASWCLASPFVGSDLPGLVQEFLEHVQQEKFVDWDLLFLSGIPVESPLLQTLIHQFRPHYRIGIGEETLRFIADISQGSDLWLSERSSKFRANIRRSERKAKEAGFVIEYFSGDEIDGDAVYQRILNVERRSWKGLSETGIADGAMKKFYKKMIPRLIRRDALRVIFIREKDKDIAFIFGGLLGNTYRGLQMSFDNDYRKYSLGNLVQYKMIEWLADEGLEKYDLGSEVEYKMKWAKERLLTTTIWIWKN